MIFLCQMEIVLYYISIIPTTQFHFTMYAKLLVKLGAMDSWYPLGPTFTFLYKTFICMCYLSWCDISQMCQVSQNYAKIFWLCLAFFLWSNFLLYWFCFSSWAEPGLECCRSRPCVYHVTIKLRSRLHLNFYLTLYSDVITFFAH